VSNDGQSISKILKELISTSLLSAAHLYEVLAVILLVGIFSGVYLLRKQRMLLRRT
jgi:hypothetical protein